MPTSAARPTPTYEAAPRGLVLRPAWASVPPRPADDVPLAQRVALMLALGRTLVGQTEWPAGSNRGWLPDLLADHFGEPRGLAWCARGAGFLRWWARLPLPGENVGSCDAWRDWGERTHRWVSAGACDLLNPAQAPAGSVILYTNWQRLPSGRYDAIHAGILTEVRPGGSARQALEMNTSAADFDANGGAVTIKPVWRAGFYGLLLPT